MEGFELPTSLESSNEAHGDLKNGTPIADPFSRALFFSYSSLKGYKEATFFMGNQDLPLKFLALSRLGVRDQGQELIGKWRQGEP